MNSILKEYKIHGILGKGTFSIVKLGIDKATGEKVAIKILNKKKIVNQSDVERVEREINILKNINHINLIKINKIKEDAENYYLIMEYCESGELFNYILKKIRLDESESAYYYYQLINGLDYIHSKNIVHRDLKPENLLLYNKNILKIIDFGLSNYSNDELLSTPCGSPCYASPEMISGKKYDGNLIDIWATGIILFAMLCGFLPFEGQTNEILYKNIVICKVDYPKFLSDISIDLLKQILVPDPEKRIQLSEIKEHPFYSKGKEIFKKRHPSIFEECEKNIRLKKIEEKYNKILNFDYSRAIAKTEGNERYEINRRKNIHSMNLDNRLNINNNSKNKNDSINSFHNTPDKNKKFHFKKLNPLNQLKYDNNNKYLLKLKKDTNNIEKHIFNQKERNTDLNNYNLHFRKKSENSNIEKYLFRNDLPNLLYLVNTKETSRFSNNDKNNKKDNSSNKKRNIFHSIDIDHSNLKFNFYNFQKDKKMQYIKNKNIKNIETVRINTNYINSYKHQEREPKLENLSPTKNYIIKKIKLINENKKSKNSTNNNTKIGEKYNSEEKIDENNNYISTKRNKLNFYDYNSISISNNNNNNNNIDNNKKNKKKHFSRLSFNNNYFGDFTINPTKKDNKILQENRFNKYFKLKNTKNSKPNSHHKLKDSYIPNNNQNYYVNKNYLNNTIGNNENDKNYINYNRPSITINSMNYNLNLYEPKIYLSTLFNDDERGNNKLFNNKNNNMPSKDKSLNKNNKSKSRKYFSNIINNNIYNNRPINNKTINSLIKTNYLTQQKSNISDSIKTNYNEKTFNNIPNNHKLVKLKTNIIVNKRKFYRNSKGNKNNNRNLKSLEQALNNNNNNKNIENTKNNESTKENQMIKNKFKKIRSIKKLYYLPDLLGILKQKRNENNTINNNYITSEQQRVNVFSPSLTLENDKNNLEISNNNIKTNKNSIRNFFFKNKINKKKNKNIIKKSNVLDSLIRDFLNFSNISSKDNSNIKNNFNFNNTKA